MRVYVGMSGGVDSSLSAALLKEQGHKVTGVYMKNWTEDLPGMRCPWADDLADAKRVAVQLGIDLRVYDFETEYKHKVVDYMVAEYKAGRTPNPDIMCNQEVKFKLFLETALEDGAEMIATGHYARVLNAQASPGLLQSSGSMPLLMQAKDSNKDQTYFLYRITSRALSSTIFPLGEYTKTEVREMARKRNLFTAEKKDSQGICFVGQIGVKDFLSQYVPAQPGDIVDEETGNIIGRHEGAIFYTLGQRHGLGIGGGLPYYVVSKDMERNIVFVTRNLNDGALWKDEITLDSLHWINGPPLSKKLEVRVRHRAQLASAEIKLCEQKGASLYLKEPQRAVTPGQSIVIYDGYVCLGGGIVS